MQQFRVLLGCDVAPLDKLTISLWTGRELYLQTYSNHAGVTTSVVLTREKVEELQTVLAYFLQETEDDNV